MANPDVVEKPSRRRFTMGMAASYLAALPLNARAATDESLLTGASNEGGNRLITELPGIASSEEGRWDSYIRSRDGDTDFIHAVEFAASPDTLGPSAHTRVYADRIVVQGAISMPGRSVSMFAREIVWSPGASLDTSGSKGSDHLHPAPPRTQAELEGLHGETGALGLPAGRVELVARRILGQPEIKAEGGRGGAGQQGGKGGIGRTGDVGSRASKGMPPSRGGQGGQGARGGIGGIGGQGGRGGDVVILTREPLAGAVQALIAGGCGGDPGGPGDGGEVGPGGPPGNRCFMSIERTAPNGLGPGIDVVESCYPDPGVGPEGPKGEKGPLQLIPAKDGDPGNLSMRVDSASVVAASSSLVQLRMALQASELALLNRRYEQLDDRLQWIIEIGGANAEAVAGSDPSRQAWRTIATAASVLQGRLRLGLDAFGYDEHHVSSLSYDQLLAVNRERLQTAELLEKEYERYLNARDDLSAMRQSLNIAIEKARQAELNTRAEVEQASNNILKLQSEIADLTQALAIAERDIVVAEREFERSVRAMGGCSLPNLLLFVGGVVAIGSGAFAAYSALGSAVVDINAGLPAASGVIKKLKVVTDTFQKAPVGTHLAAMQKGFADIESALKDNDAKVVVSRESFEKELEKFEGLVQAREYRDRLRHMADIARARNDKQVSLTAELGRAHGLLAKAAALTSEAEQARTQLATTGNPAFVEHVVFLHGYTQTAKLRLLETLELQRRSLVYATLVPIEPKYRLQKVVELREAFDRFGDAWLKAIEERNGEPLVFEGEYHVDFLALPALKDQLQETGAVAFTIPVGYPDFDRGGWSFVTVTEVNIDLSYLTTQTGRFTARLEHVGNATFTDSSGQLFHFAHKPRATILSFQRQGAAWRPTVTISNNLRGSEGRYLFLSPFATWRFSIADRAIDLPNWSRMRTLTFRFKGMMYPRAQSPVLEERRRALSKAMNS